MSGGFRDKLRRQRREDAPSKITALRQQAKAAVERGLSKRSARVAAHQGCTSGDPAELRIERNALGSFAARVLEYPLEHVHGSVELGAALAKPAFGWDVLGQDPGLAGLELDDAVFVDTETTGLSGGAGTQVFLIGLGRFVEDRFVLWQGFLRDAKEEPALLEACAERLEGCSGLVSFFGKSFDRHRLHERFAFQRRTSPFLALPHLDLYWLCRRLGPRGAEDGKLRTMERLVSGLERSGDLPGSEAPAAWFAYQRGQPHLLEAVFEHHREDVLSLVTVAAEFARLCRGSRCEEEAALLIARCLHKRKDARAAAAWAEAWERCSRELRRDCAVEYAAILRRAKDAPRALDVLEAVRDGAADDTLFQASLERLRIHRSLTRDHDAAQRELSLARARLPECGLQWVRERWRKSLDEEAERLARALERARARASGHASR